MIGISDVSFKLANGRIVNEETDVDKDGCRSGIFYGKIPALT
jgi:hypothetical protein